MIEPKTTVYRQNWRPVPENLRKRAEREAYKIVMDSVAAGMKPRFGGGYKEHLQGKLAELLFLSFLRKNKVKNIESQALRKNYKKDVKNKFDFVVNGLTIEIKSKIRTGKNGSFLYPADQLSDYVPNYIVFIEFNKDLTEYNIAGYIQGWRVKMFKINRKVPHPAYEIPFYELSSIHKLISLLRNAV